MLLGSGCRIESAVTVCQAQRSRSFTQVSEITFKIISVIIHTMGKLIEEFNDYRTKMNDRIMESANTNIKRFFALDTTTYADGALDVKTKEMLGLVASMVLRCDDCIKYHLGKCHEAGVNSDEMNEIFMIANLVGGSIVIPHYRRAVEYWDELQMQS